MMGLHLTKGCLLLHILVLCSATAAFASAMPAENVSGPFGACWSPDSYKVAFILAEDGARDTLYVAYSDGSNARVLIKGERFQDVAWASDGERVAVGSAPRGADAVVHIVEVYGEGRESVALGRSAENVALVWSADSKRLVVQLDDSILLVRPADKSVDVVDDAEPPVHRVFFEGPPPLSPDKKLLLAAGPVDPLAWLWEPRPADVEQPVGQADLYAWLVKVEGERYTLPVAQYGSLAGPLVWAPTGKAVAFMTKTAPGRSAHSPSRAVWMNVVSDVGTPRIDAKKIIDPLSKVPVWSPAGDCAGYFWRDPTGKSFFNYVNVAFTTVLPLEEVFESVLFAAWNEPESVFLVAVTRDGETVCAAIDVGYFSSGEMHRLATVSEPFDHLLPSPDLNRLLLKTNRDGKPAFAIFDVNTGEVAQLIDGTVAEGE
jgi:hypothetical protein